MSKIVTLDELAQVVQDGHRIGVGGALFSRLPIALIQSVIANKRKELEYITWGGGLALELFLAADAIDKIIFCFSSLDIFGLAPLFRKALEEESVAFEEWSALGMIQGFHAAEQQLPSMPFQVPHGSDLINRSRFAPLTIDPVRAQTVGAARALPLDVFLLHAQRADEAGNVEIQGALGLDRSAIGATDKVLVTAEEIVPVGTFQNSTRSNIFPRTFIHAVAHAPNGAYPTSCVPYYFTDYRELLEATSHVPVQLNEPDPQRLNFASKAARIPSKEITGTVLLRSRGDVDLKQAPTIDEQMVVSLARHYDNDSVCSAGAVSPLAVASYLLAKKTHAPGLVTMMISGGLVDADARPMALLMAESMDFETAVLHCGGDESYHWYYQRGFVTHEVVSAAQIDRYGNTNNIWVTSPSGRRIRLPGQGGMADVANLHQNFMLYVTRHSTLSMVDKVDYVSASRGLVSDEERENFGLQPGYTKVITNLGIFELDKESHELELVSTHPGVTIDEIVKNTGFGLRISDTLTETEPPTEEELHILRTEVDPLGIRRLEFIGSRERSALIEELLNYEEAAIRELIGGTG